MKKNLTKKLAALLITVMILGALPAFPVFAEDVLPDHYDGGALIMTGSPITGENTVTAVHADGTAEANGEAVAFLPVQPVAAAAPRLRAPLEPPRPVDDEPNALLIGALYATGENIITGTDEDGTVIMNGEAICFIPADGLLAPGRTAHNGKPVTDPAVLNSLIVARVVDRDMPRDPDDPRAQGTLYMIKKYGTDIIVRIGTMLIPFGETYKNLVLFCKDHSMENAYNLLLGILTNGATHFFPWLSPVITVCKDIYNKIVRLF